MYCNISDSINVTGQKWFLFTSDRPTTQPGRFTPKTATVWASVGQQLRPHYDTDWQGNYSEF